MLGSKVRNENKRTSKFYDKEYKHTKDIHKEYKFSDGVIKVIETMKKDESFKTLGKLKKVVQKLIE